MKKTLSPYHGFRHPGEIISHAVWLYHRFTLSFRNVEEILVSWGVDVTYESVRQWCLRFGHITDAIGFRRFSLRGKRKVDGQWKLMMMLYNILKIHRYGWAWD